MCPPSTHAIGATTEVAAAAFLTRLGWTILERNWRTPGGELDIVARDGDTLVFVEVRARRSAATYLPEETVNGRKVARLLAAARAYVDVREWEGPCRFDVVAITTGDTSRDIRLIRDAFTE